MERLYLQHLCSPLARNGKLGVDSDLTDILDGSSLFNQPTACDGVAEAIDLIGLEDPVNEDRPSKL